jgi:hypothetical protein
MPRHANKTSFKPGFTRTGAPAMTAEERKLRQKYYYKKHKRKTIEQNWERQIRQCGWTPEEYRGALEGQRGVCFICLGGDRKRLSADHCHKTGKRRHLLCTRCNTVLGLIKEDPIIMRRMEAYCAQFSGDGEVERRDAA